MKPLQLPRVLRPAALFILFVTPVLARAEWTPNDAQQEALQAVNAIRKEMKLPPYTQDEHLSKAAMAHAAFTDRYNMHHEEKPGLDGFTGVKVRDRIRAAGYPSHPDIASEVISYRLEMKGVTMCVRRLLDAPYHRSFWMHPGSMSIGAGVYGQTITIDYAGSPEEGTVVYPYDGQTDVPVLWTQRENPNPHRIWKLSAPSTIRLSTTGKYRPLIASLQCKRP